MTRKELFSESTQILNSYFNSETVENLEGTDESAVYDRSIQTIEERILIREDRIGDFKEFFRLMSTSQISNRFVDPLSSRFPVKSQPRKRLST